MKVVLNEDIKGTGKKGDIVNVSDGYARNFLLPRGKVREANASAVNEVESQRSARDYHAAQDLQSAKETAAAIDGKTVTITARSGESGKLFGAVTAKEIATAIKEQLGQTVDRRKINLDGDIKTVGDYHVELKVHTDVTATVTVKIND